MPDVPEIPASTPADPKRPKVRSEVKPLSIVDFTPFSVLVFNRSVFIPAGEGREEVKHEVMIQVRRTARDVYDDPTSIPLTAVPALVMMLEEISKSAMVLTPAAPQPQPGVPAKAPKKNKKRR